MEYLSILFGSDIMEFQNLIKASSILKVVLGNISVEDIEEKELADCIEKLKADLGSFDSLADEL
jgi:hypothetical protein